MGHDVHVHYAYDALGRQHRAGVPEIVDRPIPTTLPSERNGDWTGFGAPTQSVTEYDVLGRPILITAPNGEQTEHRHEGDWAVLLAVGYRTRSDSWSLSLKLTNSKNTGRRREKKQKIEMRRSNLSSLFGFVLMLKAALILVLSISAVLPKTM